jgi:hypothetical protein
MKKQIELEDIDLEYVGNSDMSCITPVNVTGYLMKFGQPNIAGIIYTKESINEENLKSLIEKGEIISYEITDEGIKITKNLNDYKEFKQ